MKTSVSHEIPPIPVWRNILWREWLVNRDLIVNLAGLWLVATLVLPVFTRTTPVIWACILLGQVLAVRLGGGDAGSGSEAFSLALPARRGDLFWIRLAFGAVVLSGFLLVGQASVLYQVGQGLWAIFVESGMTDGAWRADHFDSWPFAFSLALGSYAVTFALTANHGGYSVFTSAWIIGLGLWLLVVHTLGFAFYTAAAFALQLGFPSPRALLLDRYAAFMVVASELLGVAALAAGWIAYKRKAAGSMLPTRGPLVAVFLILLTIGWAVAAFLLAPTSEIWKP